MSGIVINFLRMEVLNMHPAIYLGIAGAWVLLLFSAFMSLRSLSINTWAKVLWLLIIIALPVLGLFLYALRCLCMSNWGVIAFMFHARRLNSQIATPDATRKNA